MAAIQHKDIAEADLHEPKGVSTAALGEIYVADGAGSGAWSPIASYSCMKGASAGNTTGILTTFLPINEASIGGTITWTTNSKSADITHDLTNGAYQVANAGTYHILATINFIAVAADDFYFTFGIDSGSGIVEQSAYVESIVNTTSTSDTKSLTVTCIKDLVASDKVYLMVKSTGGNEFALNFVNFLNIRIL